MEAFELKLLRPYDREPSNHYYAEPFDSEIDAFVGGPSAWSVPRNKPGGYPEAAPLGKSVKVVLHEDGPVFQFLLENWNQIPNAVSAIAAMVSAWYAARAFRKSLLPPGDFRTKGGSKIVVGDIEVSVEGDLSPQQLAELAGAVAQTRLNWSKPQGSKAAVRRRKK